MHGSLLIFVLGAGAMLLVPLLVLARGFLRARAVAETAEGVAEQAEEARRRQENIRHARAQLAALQSGAEGGGLSAAELREREDEIKSQLLDDTRAEAETDAAAAERGRGAGVAGGIALCVAFLLLAPVLYFYVGTPQALTDAPPPAAARSGDLQAVIAALQQRVEAQPQDSEGLVLLAAALMVTNRPREAADYYRRARALRGDEPQLLIALAEALMAGGGTASEVEAVLQDALALAPDEPYLLWIAGVWARDQGDVERALSFFQSVEMMTTEAEALQVVRTAIAALEGDDDVDGEVQQTAAAADETAAVAGGVRLRVQVALAPALAAQVQGEEAVFIFARAAAADAAAANAPPAPLAVQRVRVADLPLTLVLDDSMAMLPNLALSDFSNYEVVARVAKSGSPTEASGDLFARAAVRRAGGEMAVTLLINAVVP